jgi:hypothetical protein
MVLICSILRDLKVAGPKTPFDPDNSMQRLQCREDQAIAARLVLKQAHASLSKHKAL